MQTLARRSATDLQRRYVYGRDNGKCHYCHVSLQYNNFHVDHKQPWSKGGPTKLSNLVASCYICNIAKNDMDYHRYINLLEEKGLAWRRKRYFGVKSSFAISKTKKALS